MEINRKNFPGLYWLGRCSASLLVAAFASALVGQYGQYAGLPRWLFGPKVPAIALLVAFAVLWIAVIWMNVPQWIARFLDTLWRILTSIFSDTGKAIVGAMRALIAAARPIFWSVVAAFLIWKLCEFVWAHL